MRHTDNNKQVPRETVIVTSKKKKLAIVNLSSEMHWMQWPKSGELNY